MISIVTPAFNRAAYIGETIESVLQQSYQNWEMIIVDDGSTDGTAAVVQRYLSDQRIRLIKQISKQISKGPASSRNRGIESAKGEYISFLDADDLFLPHKLETSLAAMDAETDLVYSAMILIDDQGKQLKEFECGKSYAQNDFLAEMLFRNFVIPSATMVRRHCALEEPFIEGMCGLEDYELFLRWAQRYRFKYLPEPLTQYRRHARSLSSTADAGILVEKQLVRSFGRERIREIVWNTSYSSDEKQLLYGKILCKIDAFEEAVQVLSSLESPLALFYKGNGLLVLEKLEEAKEVYQRALQMHAQNPAVYNNLGVIEVRQGYLEQGKSWFQAAMQLKPGYLDPQHNLELIQMGKPVPLEQLRMTMRELRETLMTYAR